LAAAYRKDPSEEVFLQALNDHMAPFEEACYQALEERWPVLHVFGAPRSGTTLAIQLIAANLDVGYIDHLTASFWRAPVAGIRLSRKLLGDRRTSSYESSFGRTEGLHEPHEFGYFWADLLHQHDFLEPSASDAAAIDWRRVRTVLLNMTHAFGRPLAFKTFFAGWYLAELSRAMPRTCYVYVRRDPVANALSILKMRREYAGSEASWVGIRPRAQDRLEGESPEVQAAGQVHYLTAGFERRLGSVEQGHVVEVQYEDMCRDPVAFLEKVRGVLAAHGPSVERFGTPDPFPVRTGAADDRRTATIRNALRRFSEEGGAVR